MKSRLDVWRWVGDYALDLSKLPVTVRQAPAPMNAPLLAILGIACLVVSVLASVGLSGSGQLSRTMLPEVLPVLAGGGLLYLAFLSRRSGRDVSFEHSGVSVKGLWFLRAEDWWMPYSAFDGVEGKAERVLRGQYYRTFYVIQLRHPEPEKNIPLFVHYPGSRGMDQAVLAQKTKDYAQALGVAVV
ncbi:hypothetical protein [Pelagibius litoralis]|uniref:hypothetical protein n=1 Tax=Pelagibius litoralis TaxID=374515 RepID=UPI00141ED269|nr:hypothetical protein [Pelagibius litoralis]